MPLLSVSLSLAPDAALSAAVAKKLTALTAAHLGKAPEVTAISVTHTGADHWFIGGMDTGSLLNPTFSLVVRITAGTNTKTQIAGYLAAVHTAMAAILNGVSEASYIIVDEVPAANWGYAGQSQELRSVSATLAVAP